MFIKVIGVYIIFSVLRTSAFSFCLLVCLCCFFIYILLLASGALREAVTKLLFKEAHTVAVEPSVPY